MAKKAKPKSVSLNVSISDRDMKLLERYAKEQGQQRSAVVREALDALREKRRYAAKRAIEEPVPRSQFRNLAEVERLSDVKRLSDIRLDPEPQLQEAIRMRPRVYEEARAIDVRPRITTNINEAELDALEKLLQENGQTKAEFVRALIQDAIDPDGPLADPVRRDQIARSSTIIFYSRLFISALEEAINYDPMRHHNQPPPPLRLEDSDYLKEIRALTTELKRLNDNLEAAATAQAKPAAKKARVPRKAVEKSAIKVKQHLNTFLNKYASALGTGAAALTIGTAGALLYQLGVPLDFILKHVKR